MSEIAIIKTSEGEITVELWPDVAPGHVENFKRLAKERFYDGTCFHRVIKGFMVQCGDPLTKDEANKSRWGTGGPGYFIKAEFNNRPHVRGVLSMARANDPNSAGSQFFICHGDPRFLDHQYTAFGKLIKGDDVLERIASTPTEAGDRPTRRIHIQRIMIVGAESAEDSSAILHPHGENDSEDASIISPLVIVIGLVEKTDWQATFLNDQAKNSDVVNYGKLLLCFLIASDNKLSEEESHLFNSFWQKLGGSELTPEEIHHMVASSQDEAFKTLSEPPKFFRHLVASDVRHRTNYAAGALQALQLFVQVIVGIDGEITDEEAQAAASVLARLSLYAQSMGLATDTSEKPTQAEVKKDEPPTGQSSDSVADLLKQMDALIGLAQVKEEVNGLVNLIKVRKLRQDRGIKCPPISLHLVFSGNPGTGKTTVARLLGGIFKALGVLSNGHLVEVDRSGLVAGYVGQTAIKVKEVTDRSLGGILFVDEAYSLASKSEQDYGREAVETLLKTMEDHRDNLVVIAAGYTDKMEEFLNINPGLRSRFNKFIQFQDYIPEELLQIFSKMCGDNGYEYTPAFLEKIREILTIEFDLRGKDFANARTARNIFERVVANHSNRLARNSSPSDKELITFEADDIGTLSRRA